MRRTSIASAALGLVICGLVSSGCTGKKVKILVRKHDTGILALDGHSFHLAVLFAAGKDDLESRTSLVTDRRINVENEFSTSIRNPGQGKDSIKPVEWKQDPKKFDYLVSWIIESVEHTKTTFGENVQISVKESWKVDKVSDPSVTKSWTCNYLLRGGPLSTSQQTAEDEVRNVIVPARDAIIKEIKAFVSSP